MSYASVQQLRERYRSGIDLGFVQLDDSDLEEALRSASSEIDSWRPAGALSEAALDVLADKAMTLARMLAHKNDPLSTEHPIVRDGMAVRKWLEALASGRVLLPSDTTEPVPDRPTTATNERTLVFTDDLWETYQQ